MCVCVCVCVCVRVPVTHVRAAHTSGLFAIVAAAAAEEQHPFLHWQKVLVLTWSAANSDSSSPFLTTVRSFNTGCLIVASKKKSKHFFYSNFFPYKTHVWSVVNWYFILFVLSPTSVESKKVKTKQKKRVNWQFFLLHSRNNILNHTSEVNCEHLRSFDRNIERERGRHNKFRMICESVDKSEMWSSDNFECKTNSPLLLLLAKLTRKQAMTYNTTTTLSSAVIIFNAIAKPRRHRRRSLPRVLRRRRQTNWNKNSWNF